ncbi:MAG: MFS transporter, partial [Microbacterium sp.]|uniref:MFS transporter n=2 Tax=Microbacterium TaxID=33882 RepID=UPI003BB1E44C
MQFSRGHLIDLTPLRTSPAFARMWIGSLLTGIGGQLTIVTVMLHVFDLTASTLAVSMIAVAGLVPMIVAGLYGGMLADAFDRRKVALIAASIAFCATALLAALTWTGTETIWWLYALSMIIAATNSVGFATRTAIVPRLIPIDQLAAASALNGISFGLTVMAGPALAGLLVALTGFGW